MQICYEAHKDVWDRSGAPYVFHPFTVAQSMDDETSVAVALLHDVVEDTDMTFEDLSAQGIPDRVISALRLLTHDRDVPYMDYIRAIKGDPTAVKVKLADLAHNMDLSRYCRPMTEREAAKQLVYAEAKKILESDSDVL